MNCVAHQSPGLWVNPDDRMDHYTDLATWGRFGQTAGRGKFDALFLADVIGIYDTYGGGPEAALRQATQVPVNDPALLIPRAWRMRPSTSALPSPVRCSSTIRLIFSRLISTLDHLTEGRIAWNVVTSYLDSAARSLGLEGLQPHDQRYDMADEYLESAAICGRRILGGRRSSQRPRSANLR